MQKASAYLLMRQFSGLILLILATSFPGMGITITNLGLDVDPYAINNSDNVVGQENIAGVYQAFLYTPPEPGRTTGSITGFVRDGVATAINDTGEIAMVSDFGNFFAPNHVLAGVFPGFADLGVGSVTGINNAGQMVGSTGGGPAIFTIGSTTLQFGPTVGGVSDINNYGQVTGSAQFGNKADAFIYSNGVFTDLGSLSPIWGSEGIAINDAGQVAGNAPTVTGTHAFLYTDGHMVDIGVLGPDDSTSIAKGINNAGDVVGFSDGWGGANLHAFVYSNGVLIDLNSLLPPDSGWVLTTATGINDRGQIIGTGMFNGQGNYGFLLDTDFSTAATATPEPASWILLAGGIVVFFLQDKTAINKLLSHTKWSGDVR